MNKEGIRRACLLDYTRKQVAEYLGISLESIRRATVDMNPKKQATRDPVGLDSIFVDPNKPQAPMWLRLPTDAMPGSEEKIEIMRLRKEFDLPVCVHGDFGTFSEDMVA